MEKKFIIWDEGDGHPRREDSGEFISSGLVGVVTLDNAFLTTYGARPEGSKAYDALEVGERVVDVLFSLSGSKGRYSVYRVA